MTDLKKIYVVWGYSDVGGHDLARKQRPLQNGEDVFLFKDGIFEQNPHEPVFTNAKTGSTPLLYFADKLAGLTGDDIAFMWSRTGGWHDGVSGISRADVSKALAKLQPALDAGWELGGVILATGPGDSDTMREVRTYEHRFKVVAHRIRDIFSDDDLPIFNMQTPLPANNVRNYPPERAHLVAALRKEMVDVGRHVFNVDTVRSDPRWDGTPDHGGSSHLAVPGMVHWGHALADTVFDFWS